MKGFNRLWVLVALCIVPFFADARDVEIRLVAGSLEPLRNQSSLLFTTAWDNTLIEGQSEQDWFATKKNAAKQEEEWYQGKELVDAGFFRDGGMKWGLFALEKAGVTLYVASGNASSWLQVSTAQKLNGQAKDEEMFVSADRANVHYRVIVNCDEFVDLGNGFVMAYNGGKVRLSYKVVNVETGETIAELSQAATKNAVSSPKLSIRMMFTVQHALKAFAEYLVEEVFF